MSCRSASRSSAGRPHPPTIYYRQSPNGVCGYHNRYNRAEPDWRLSPVKLRPISADREPLSTFTPRRGAQLPPVGKPSIVVATPTVATVAHLVGGVAHTHPFMARGPHGLSAMGITTRRETERWSIDLTGMTMFWLHATAFTAAFALAYGIIAACLLFAAVGIAFLCGVETTNPDDEVSDR